MKNLEDYIKLADAATEGPWEAVRNNSYWEINPVVRKNSDPFTIGNVCASGPENPDGGLQETHAKFIAASRQLGPAMAKALIEAEGALKNVQMLISEGAKHGMNAIDNPEWGMRLYESNQKTSQSLATIQRLRNGGV